MKHTKLKLAVLDLETDPFLAGRKPKAFASGFYDGKIWKYFWGDKCVPDLMDWIASQPIRYLIYAHNAGKFDFYFFLDRFLGPLNIINNRIVKGEIANAELRDSYAIMPFALREFEKDTIDYNKLEKDVRKKHKDEIVSYLKKDCTSLYQLVEAYHEEFGDVLTIGSAAFKELKKFTPVRIGQTSQTFDEKFRENFYHGGRVQVLRPGIVQGPVNIYDVNSMYPYVMTTDLHPIDSHASVDKRIRANTCFVVAEGKNYGAFASKSDGTLNFDAPSGRFFVTIHEWQAAEETRRFKTGKIIKTYGFDARISFSEFVDHFYSARMRATMEGNKIHRLFYKYILNSGYGKFAQNPDNFSEHQITSWDSRPEGTQWEISYLTDDYLIWKRPTEKRKYNNVCTGASITGAARAALMRGLSAAVEPYYCDTDSIICQSMHGVAMDNNTLGSWKLEGSGNLAAFSGKKLYAIWDTTQVCCCETKGPKECKYHVKKAHKGALLTYKQIWDVTKGETVTVSNQVPSFKMDGDHLFITRRIKRTV